ncbi:MAG: hypothetical protein QOC76_2548 [Mycobacterium sp.]|nr:hypothetical protein [Mycobacterium sp.]
MTGSSPYPPSFGAPPPGSGPPPATGPGNIPRPPGNFGPSSAPSRARTGLLASGVILGVLLGIAALVLSAIGITRGPEPRPPQQTNQAEPERLFVDDADKALCEDVGPLMKESRTMKNTFSDAGPQGSPEQRAVIAKFVFDTRNWADRTQKVLNDHSSPPRYLTRTVQRYVDDMLLFVGNISADRDPESADSQAWDLSIVDLRGPRGRCRDVGVDWWG